MGDKAATNEVITKLVSALGDESDRVRASVCIALENMGEKAATNEVITKLVSALGDESDDVRNSAYEALGNMGDKAATNEVITKLVSALGDKSDNVRLNACKTLGKIGERAATNEVITKLVSALGDESNRVKWNACKTLGKIGEKAATNEMITSLVSALGDERKWVRVSACEALGKIGEKAATNEVITKLVSMIINDSNIGGWQTVKSIENIFSSSAVVRQIDPGIIADLCRCRDASHCLKNISDEELIRVFLTTENPDWLCVVTRFALLRGVAVTGSEEKVVIFGEKEPLELRIRTPQLRHQLVKAFTDEKKRLHLEITAVDPPLCESAIAIPSRIFFPTFSQKKTKKKAVVAPRRGFEKRLPTMNTTPSNKAPSPH
jgi:hypothetical protein